LCRVLLPQRVKVMVGTARTDLRKELEENAQMFSTLR
jgi:hypothetical protein